MLSPEVAARFETWTPRGAETGERFARRVVGDLDLASWARARSLLWAAARLGAFAAEVGVGEDPAIVLRPAFIERFMAGPARRWSAPARRTARSNLNFLAREHDRDGPRPARLSRERAQAPYSQAELAAYVALADAQRSEARCQRAFGLLALGAGAGLLGADLRLVRGTHVLERSGGVIVVVSGRGARTVPVRAEWAARALGAAHWAKEGFVVGGADPARRNVTSPLITSLSGGADLPRLSLARLRSTWLARCAADIGLATFMAAAGVVCTQRLGDVVADLEVGDEAAAVALLGGAPA